MAATRALRELLGGCDPTSPEERDALFDRYAAIHGEPPCWDAYDFAVYCPIDPASAASLPVGSRPRVPSPGPAGAARPVSEPPTSPATPTYDIEMAQRARRHPAELLVLLGLHLGRRSSATGWLEPLRVVGAFLGRTWWFAALRGRDCRARGRRCRRAGPPGPWPIGQCVDRRHAELLVEVHDLDV